MIKNIDSKATQKGFGELVGVSQQAISKHVDTGLLKKNQNYRTWLISYCEKLRDEASGRGNDAQGELTRARTRDANASSELKYITIKEKAGELVPTSEIEPLLTAMFTAARTELLSLPDKLSNELKALYDVEVDPLYLEEKIHEVLAHLAGEVPGIIKGHDDKSRQEVDAAA